LIFVFFTSTELKNALNAKNIPLPVASVLPSTPPIFSGLPVTHAKALMSCGLSLLYSSAIHAISFFPVPISGAGTFKLGEISPLLTSSSVNLLVIFSNSSSEYFDGSIFKPPLEPPKGTSITAFLKVIKAAIASTSEALTAGLYLIPPFTGSRCSECTARQPVNTLIPLSNLTPNLIVCVLLQDLI